MTRRRAPAAERVAAHVAGRGLLAPGAPVVALVSGGGDSTLLLVLLHELGHDVRALHVDHALRGPASTADRAAVAALCARLGVPLDVVDGPVRAGAGVEARARAARRAAVARIPAGLAVATGHTADDRAETVLYRLAASGGPRSTTALRARDGRLVRPLLCLSRAEVRAELRARGVPWREDRENGDRRHARARIRRDVLPALARVNAEAARNIARHAAWAEDERDLLERLAATLVADDGALSVRRLAAAHPALQRVALRLAADRAGVVLGHDDVEALRSLDGAGRAQRHLPGGVALRERDVLRIRATGAGAWRAGPERAMVPDEGQGTGEGEGR